MKLHFFIPLLLSVLVMASCDSANDPEYASSAPSLGEFTITSDIGVHYYDAQGNDLISADDPATWPLVYKKELFADSVAFYKSDIANASDDVFYYGERHNAIIKGTTGNKYEFYVWGNGAEKFTSYIHINGTVDKIETTYRYTAVDMRWYPEKLQVKYNDVVVWKQGQAYCEIAVTKADNQTTVRTISQTTLK